MKKHSAIDRKRRAMRASANRLPIKAEFTLDREQIRQLIRHELLQLVGRLFIHRRRAA